MAAFLLIAAAMAGGCVEIGEEARPREPAPASRFETLVIPDGTVVLASLNTSLATDINHSGDPFSATTTSPIDLGGRTLIPSGAQIHGLLQNVTHSGRIKGRAQMTLRYQSIVDLQRKRHLISAEPLTLQAASDAHGEIVRIPAGTVLGVVSGHIADGSEGAAIEASAGSGAGMIVMHATKGEDLTLSPGQRLAIRTTGATNVQVAIR
jgi:hypothetical protein